MATSLRIPRLVFRVDKPFAFSISDQQTGTILFLGAVNDPRS
jgi:serpin B